MKNAFAFHLLKMILPMKSSSLVRSKAAVRDLRIVNVPINSLRANEKNPRTWDEPAAEKLRESIRKFGLVDPLICNSAKGRENVLIGGHFRWSCAKDLGMTEVPVVFVNIPNLEKERELLIRLNKNTGAWDFELLKGFDIGELLDIGFDDGDLNDIWGDSLSTEDDNFDVAQAVKEAKTTRVKTGQLYQLGSHRVLCADSTVLDNVKRVVGDAKIQMFYTDFPYNIKLDYSKGISTKGKYNGEVNDAKTHDEYRQFLKTCLENGKAVLAEDAHVFSWCDQNYVGMLQELYRELGVANKRTCLWVKNSFNLVPQCAFNKAYEPCVYGTVGKPFLNSSVTSVTEILNRDIQPGNRTIDDIVDLFDVWLAKRVNGQDYTHPTEKPTSLAEKPLRRCTKIGDCILDLCAGSGSFMTACEQMKRRAFMIEQSPVFTQVIIDRYEALAGDKAKLID